MGPGIVHLQHKVQIVFNESEQGPTDQGSIANERWQRQNEMAYAHSNTTTQGGFFERIGRFYSALKDARHRQALFITTRIELSNLTDRELQDLGIHRSMITRIAREAAYQK